MSVLTDSLSALTRSGQVGDDRLRVHLLAEREQDPLLAPAAVEVAALRAVARAGVDERLGAGHVLRPGRDVDPGEGARRLRVLALGDGDLDVDVHAAEGVDDLLEAVEVDERVVADVEAVELAEQSP